MRFESILPFVRDRATVDGEFYFERKTGRTLLYVEQWATDIYPADWDALSCNVLDYNHPGEKQDFKKWLLEGK